LREFRFACPVSNVFAASHNTSIRLAPVEIHDPVAAFCAPTMMFFPGFMHTCDTTLSKHQESDV